MTSVENST